MRKLPAIANSVSTESSLRPQKFRKYKERSRVNNDSIEDDLYIFQIICTFKQDVVHLNFLVTTTVFECLQPIDFFCLFPFPITTKKHRPVYTINHIVDKFP